MFFDDFDIVLIKKTDWTFSCHATIIYVLNAYKNNTLKLKKYSSDKVNRKNDISHDL